MGQFLFADAMSGTGLHSLAIVYPAGISLFVAVPEGNQGFGWLYCHS